MLEGNVGLGADIRDLGVNGGADQFGVRIPTQNLNHDWLLGGAEGLHRLVVGGLREVLAIDLEGEDENQRGKELALELCLFFLMKSKQTERR